MQVSMIPFKHVQLLLVCVFECHLKLVGFIPHLLSKNSSTHASVIGVDKLYESTYRRCGVVEHGPARTGRERDLKIHNALDIGLLVVLCGVGARRVRV